MVKLSLLAAIFILVSNNSNIYSIDFNQDWSDTTTLMYLTKNIASIGKVAIVNITKDKDFFFQKSNGGSRSDAEQKFIDLQEQTEKKLLADLKNKFPSVEIFLGKNSPEMVSKVKYAFNGPVNFLLPILPENLDINLVLCYEIGLKKTDFNISKNKDDSTIDFETSDITLTILDPKTGNIHSFDYIFRKQVTLNKKNEVGENLVITEETINKVTYLSKEQYEKQD